MVRPRREILPIFMRVLCAEYVLTVRGRQTKVANRLEDFSLRVDVEAQ